MNDFVLVTLYVAVIGWIMFALGRLQEAWQTSQRRTAELRAILAAVGRKLLSDLEAIQKLEDEIKRVKDKIAEELREQKDRREALTKSARPLPPEVNVLSEYPPSRKDLAWIVTFMRSADIPPQPWEPEPMTSLVWARTQTAALARGRQILNDYKTYSVASVGPFS